MTPRHSGRQRFAVIMVVLLLTQTFIWANLSCKETAPKTLQHTLPPCLGALDGSYDSKHRGHELLWADTTK